MCGTRRDQAFSLLFRHSCATLSLVPFWCLSSWTYDWRPPKHMNYRKVLMLDHKYSAYV